MYYSANTVNLTLNIYMLQPVKADFFSLLLSEKMKDSSINSLTYCVRVFLNRYDRLIVLRYYEKEIVFILDFLIQVFFNHKHNAFFNEYFYKL